jgi:hypothetical protein
MSARSSPRLAVKVPGPSKLFASSAKRTQARLVPGTTALAREFHRCFVSRSAVTISTLLLVAKSVATFRQEIVENRENSGRPELDLDTGSGRLRTAAALAPPPSLISRTAVIDRRRISLPSVGWSGRLFSHCWRICCNAVPE